MHPRFSFILKHNFYLHTHTHTHTWFSFNNTHPHNFHSHKRVHYFHFHTHTHTHTWAYYLHSHIPYLPIPSAQAGWHKVNFFKRGLTGLNSEFSFSKTSCRPKAEEPCLPYYYPITGGRIIGFIPFPRVLMLCEMQSVQDLNSCRRVQFLRR